MSTESVRLISFKHKSQKFFVISPPYSDSHYTPYFSSVVKTDKEDQKQTQTCHAELFYCRFELFPCHFEQSEKSRREASHKIRSARFFALLRMTSVQAKPVLRLWFQSASRAGLAGWNENAISDCLFDWTVSNCWKLHKKRQKRKSKL